MARFTFGGTAPDFVAVVGPAGEMRAIPAQLQLWTAATGGTWVTDLRLNGLPASTIPVPAGGQIPAFQGPDNVTELWATAGGPRVRMVAEGRAGTPGLGFVSGAGSPEGVVAAPIGTAYLDIAATRGAVQWVKVSGTGTTGWRVVYGDTGWRSVPAATPFGGAWRLRRVGAVVQVSAAAGALTFSSAIADGAAIGTLPTGFRPPQEEFAAWGVSPSPPRLMLSMAPLGAVTVWEVPGGVTSGSLRLGLTVFTTTDPWPSALPGAAA